MDITVSAMAKINLFLDITGKRNDGYHTINTLMHSIDLHDSVKVSLIKSGEIRLSSGLHFIPSDERNIAYKAAKAFFSLLGENWGADIKITKRIPVGGGLGGSSTDGAAVLEALNFLTGKPFSPEALSSLGASLSADIPFCLKKGAALCCGIGEEITPLESLQGIFALIIKPRFSLNTKEMYSLFDLSKKECVDINPMLSAFCNKDFHAICENLYNAFYLPAISKEPSLENLYTLLKEGGAEGVLMSGSGSCIYGLFDSKKRCEKLYSLLSEKGLTVFLTRLM